VQGWGRGAPRCQLAARNVPWDLVVVLPARGLTRILGRGGRGVEPARLGKCRCCGRGCSAGVFTVSSARTGAGRRTYWAACPFAQEPRWGGPPPPPLLFCTHPRTLRSTEQTHPGHSGALTPLAIARVVRWGASPLRFCFTRGRPVCLGREGFREVWRGRVGSARWLPLRVFLPSPPPSRLLSRFT